MQRRRRRKKKKNSQTTGKEEKEENTLRYGLLLRIKPGPRLLCASIGACQDLFVTLQAEQAGLLNLRARQAREKEKARRSLTIEKQMQALRSKIDEKTAQLSFW